METVRGLPEETDKEIEMDDIISLYVLQSKSLFYYIWKEYTIIFHYICLKCDYVGVSPCVRTLHMQLRVCMRVCCVRLVW